MIYSIGYQKLTPADLRRIVQEKGIDFLLDCRTTPYGRRSEFNRKRLEEMFGSVYRFSGSTLGGFARIEEQAVADLARLAQQKRLLLLCMEEDPLTCHRHYEIAVRLHAYGITVTHLFKGEEITSTELEAK